MKVPVARCAVLGVVLTIVGVTAETSLTRRGVALAMTQTVTLESGPQFVVQRVCVSCHNDRFRSGNLSLEKFDVAAAHKNAEVAEKMIRKLRAGMMPPPGAPRPDDETLLGLVRKLEEVVDEAAARDPNPGGRTFQRLNRREYEHAIRDLLTLDVDAGNWLPPDQMSANFDNIADAQTLSPTLLEAYLNAASAISRMAVGDRNAPAIDETYTNSQYISQHPWDHVEGAPYGTRGGIVVDHVFPADGEYVFALTFSSGVNTPIEDIDISINGERMALLLYDTNPRGVAADGRGFAPTKTQPIFVRAGQHKVAAAFVRRAEGPYEDLIRPHDWSFAGGGSGGAGITTLPHVRDLIISGPYHATGISETTSRRKIFTCRPTVAAEQRSCAREIISRLGTEAYRRKVAPADLDSLMAFYDQGAKKGGFEIGVSREPRSALGSGGTPTAGPTLAGRSARGGAWHQVCRPVVPAPGSVQGAPRHERLSQLRRESRRCDET